ncbi:MAG: hypothetical protein NPIRA02_33280 [Nitrospirales bacterium]|nr:MAG: hypothetical protein NPIRA02_33280 [Nitrospirales bacterium]
MHYILLTCLSLCFMVSASLVSAKDTGQEQSMDPKAMMEMYQKLATPGEPHALFASLAGNWTTTMKTWMEPGKPPMESTGTAKMTMLLDGRFLQQEFTGEMMGQPYSGVGIDAYDNMTKKYVTMWIDTMGTGMFMMEGTASADGKTITLKGSHPEPGGGQMSHRAVWTIVDENTQTFDMYGTHHGGEEMKVMELTYTRNS